MLELHSTEQSLLVLTERKKKGKISWKEKKKKEREYFGNTSFGILAVLLFLFKLFVAT